jgi:ribosomal subunit interface protein
MADRVLNDPACKRRPRAAANDKIVSDDDSRDGTEQNMPLRISGKNLNIGEALRVHVTERLNASTAKYFDGHVSGHVTICPEGSGFRTDCNLHLASGVVLQADGRAHEPYASFEQAADRIEKRLRRYKSRLKSHHDHHGLDHDGAGEVAATYVLQAPDHEDEAPAGFSPAVIAESTTKLRRLSVAQAVADLDLTGVTVVVFRHATTGRVNLVYRRGDDNIGWVDPPGGE